MAPGVGRGQGRDRHGLPQLTSPCCVRESQSHIKEMLQLVLNWEVSQAAAVRTGMICGALWDPKEGQILQMERRGFLGLPRKDLTETLKTGFQGWESPGPEADSDLASRSRGSHLILALGCGEALRMVIISKASHLG